MMFDVINFFPPSIHIAECSNCGRLIGFTDDEIISFVNDKVDFELKGITCPQCDCFLLIDNPLGQNEENDVL